MQVPWDDSLTVIPGDVLTFSPQPVPVPEGQHFVNPAMQGMNTTPTGVTIYGWAGMTLRHMQEMLGGPGHPQITGYISLWRKTEQRVYQKRAYKPSIFAKPVPLP